VAFLEKRVSAAEAAAERAREELLAACDREQAAAEEVARVRALDAQLQVRGGGCWGGADKCAGQKFLRKCSRMFSMQEEHLRDQGCMTGMQHRLWAVQKASS
jgi:hypothetical protein